MFICLSLLVFWNPCQAIEDYKEETQSFSGIPFTVTNIPLNNEFISPGESTRLNATAKEAIKKAHDAGISREAVDKGIKRWEEIISGRKDLKTIEFHITKYGMIVFHNGL